MEHVQSLKGMGITDPTLVLGIIHSFIKLEKVNTFVFLVVSCTIGNMTVGIGSSMAFGNNMPMYPQKGQKRDYVGTIQKTILTYLAFLVYLAFWVLSFLIACTACPVVVWNEFIFFGYFCTNM